MRFFKSYDGMQAATLAEMTTHFYLKLCMIAIAACPVVLGLVALCQ